MVQFKSFIVSALVASVAATSLTGEPKVIADFSASNPSVEMETVNDPVMGGESYSTATVKDGALVWEGELKIVKKLRAPGFCVLETKNFASGSLLAGGSSLCFLIDPAASALLGPLSASISSANWSGYLRSGRKHQKDMGTSYNAALELSDEKRTDSLQAYCADLNADTFKAQKMWHKTDVVSPPMDKAFLESAKKIRLSWGGEKKVPGKFSVKIISMYVNDDADVELFV